MEMEYVYEIRKEVTGDFQVMKCTTRVKVWNDNQWLDKISEQFQSRNEVNTECSIMASVHSAFGLKKSNEGLMR